MPYRKISFENEHIYHIYNRGVEKRKIFTSNRDYQRFIQSFIYYTFAENKLRFARFRPVDMFTLNKKRVEVLAYCLMPNHFHMILREISDGGISNSIGQLSNSYTKYFNTKYKRVGPLFQGNFKAVWIENTEQLVHVSRYVHLNPYVANIVEKNINYRYSSLEEYLNGKGFCNRNYIMELFETSNDYNNFVFDNLDYGKSLEIVKHQLIDEEN